MSNPVQQLIEIFHHFGSNYVMAGCGSASYKNEDHIWINSSQATLATISEDDFVWLNRKKPLEANLHHAIEYCFVMHLQPAMVNALMCGKDSANIAAELFPEALYIPYANPGHALFMATVTAIEAHREKQQKDPYIIFLENNGVFVCADSTKEIIQLFEHIIGTLENKVDQLIETIDLPVPDNITSFIPAIRMMFSEKGLKTCLLRHHDMIAHFYKSDHAFEKIGQPCTPNVIFYCKSKYLYIEQTGSPESIIKSVQSKLTEFVEDYGYHPNIIVLKDIGLLAINDTWQKAKTSLDIFEDQIKISYYSENFGGPRFLHPEQIAFIESTAEKNDCIQEVLSQSATGKVIGKTAIVTGGAMGLGAGIARSLVKQGANVVIADINEEEGLPLSMSLSEGRQNKAWFTPTDVGNPASLQKTIKDTIKNFGGIDLLISNAGMMQPASLDELDPARFNRMTKVNYSAFFYCVKYVSSVMKLQQAYKTDHYTDIIQINSKYGLTGSNFIFAYAGSKFGGIGLTQSFALELMPHKIKVNAICPGNFFEGPIWSDPDRGLFAKYLNAGTVPGAKTIEDVKKHYEKMVPAQRGCRMEDVIKAIYYLIDQEYETGQALPVTGGQIMLH